MNKKYFLFFSLVILTASSCSSIFREYNKESFTNYVWNKADEIVFHPQITDIKRSYNLILGIRYIYGLPLDSIGINIKSISPSGKEVMKLYSFKIKDKQNKYIGDCSGDMCDLEAMVEEFIKFEEAGNYKFIVTNTNPVESISGIMELGLIIE
jgi:gliding motility-associated lipoprotein GldH